MQLTKSPPTWWRENNKIKVLRRRAFGLPDDDYFFQRLFDASNKNYVRNPPSLKICD